MLLFLSTALQNQIPSLFRQTQRPKIKPDRSGGSVRRVSLTPFPKGQGLSRSFSQKACQKLTKRQLRTTAAKHTSLSRCASKRAAKRFSTSRQLIQGRFSRARVEGAAEAGDDGTAHHGQPHRSAERREAAWVTRSGAEHTRLWAQTGSSRDAACLGGSSSRRAEPVAPALLPAAVQPWDKTTNRTRSPSGPILGNELGSERARPSVLPAQLSPSQRRPRGASLEMAQGKDGSPTRRVKRFNSKHTCGTSGSLRAEPLGAPAPGLCGVHCSLQTLLHQRNTRQAVGTLKL